METSIEVKIKVGKKEIVLDSKEAKELYDKLGDIFSNKTEWVSYRIPWRYTYTYGTDPSPGPYKIWCSSNGTATINATVNI